MQEALFLCVELAVGIDQLQQQGTRRHGNALPGLFGGVGSLGREDVKQFADHDGFSSPR